MMEELDVSKPIQYRKKIENKLRFLSYLIRDGEKKLLLIETKPDGNEFTVLTNLQGSWLESDEEHDFDIINVPEVKFSWDKPIRCKDKRYKVIDINDNYALIEHPDKSRSWANYYQNGSYSNYLDSFYDLENYEPEEKYETRETIGNSQLRLGNFSLHYGVELMSRNCQEMIGFFRYEEDAEAFKKLKEQGL